MTDPKPIAAFRDDAQKCVFVRLSDGSIERYALDSSDHYWFGAPDEGGDSDPEGVVWAALTGQAANTTIIFANLPKRRPNITKFYADDEPFEALADACEAAKLERIRAAARKLSIDTGGVRSNQDVAALLVEIFAP